MTADGEETVTHVDFKEMFVKMRSIAKVNLLIKLIDQKLVRRMKILRRIVLSEISLDL